MTGWRRIEQIDPGGDPIELGDRVRVEAGVFRGAEGVVDEVRRDRGLLNVRAVILGRWTPVELGFGQISRI